MAVYVVRHAKAAPGYPDEFRPLTAEGERVADEMGQHLARTGVRVARIYHSGLVRARQTAEALTKHLQPAGGLHHQPGLEPEGDPLPIAAWLEAEEEEHDGVMVVSHMPFVDRLVSMLLCGDPNAGLVDYKLCAVTRLNPRPTHGYELAWLLTPKAAGIDRA